MVAKSYPKKRYPGSEIPCIEPTNLENPLVFTILKATILGGPCLGKVSYNSAINASAKSGKEWQSAMILLQVSYSRGGGGRCWVEGFGVGPGLQKKLELVILVILVPFIYIEYIDLYKLLPVD